MIDSRNQLRSTELAKRREIIFHIQVDKQGYFVRYFDPSLILFDAVSLELGICHTKDFFSIVTLILLRTNVCYRSISMLYYSKSARSNSYCKPEGCKTFWKKAKHTKNPHLRNRGRCLHHELRFSKAQNQPSATWEVL